MKSDFIRKLYSNISGLTIYRIEDNWSLSPVDRYDINNNSCALTMGNVEWPMLLMASHNLLGNLAHVGNADKLPPLPKHIEGGYVVDRDEEDNRELRVMTPELYAKSLVDAAWAVSFPEDGSWVRMVELENERIKTAYACLRDGTVYVSTVKQVDGLDHALISSMELVIHMSIFTIAGPGDTSKLVYTAIPVEPCGSESDEQKGEL